MTALWHMTFLNSFDVCMYVGNRVCIRIVSCATQDHFQVLQKYVVCGPLRCRLLSLSWTRQGPPGPLLMSLSPHILTSSSGYLAFGTHVNLHKSLDKFAINPNHLPRFSFHKCQMHINDNPRELLTGVAGTPHRLRATSWYSPGPGPVRIRATPASCEYRNWKYDRDPLVLSGCWTGVVRSGVGGPSCPLDHPAGSACQAASQPACQYCQCSLTGGETRLGVNCHPSPCAPGPNNNWTYFADILINLTLVTRFRPFRFRFRFRLQPAGLPFSRGFLLGVLRGFARTMGNI